MADPSDHQVSLQHDVDLSNTSDGDSEPQHGNIAGTYDIQGWFWPPTSRRPPPSVSPSPSLSHTHDPLFESTGLVRMLSSLHIFDRPIDYAALFDLLDVAVRYSTNLARYVSLAST